MKANHVRVTATKIPATPECTVRTCYAVITAGRVFLKRPEDSSVILPKKYVFFPPKINKTMNLFLI